VFASAPEPKKTVLFGAVLTETLISPVVSCLTAGVSSLLTDETELRINNGFN